MCLSAIGLEGSVFLNSGERIRGVGVGSEENELIITFDLWWKLFIVYCLVGGPNRNIDSKYLNLR